MNTSIDHAALTNPTTLATAILDGTVHGQYAWSATTNICQCGGFTAKGRAMIHRALRKAGYLFFLAIYEEGNQWGICTKEEFLQMAKNPNIWFLEKGYTLAHAAHKLGDGNARKGWKIYHN